MAPAPTRDVLTAWPRVDATGELAMKRQFSFVMLAVTLTGQATAATNWKGVDEALGRAGIAQPGDVHRYGFPRSDLDVSLDGVRIKPALALGSWLAFRD